MTAPASVPALPRTPTSSSNSQRSPSLSPGHTGSASDNSSPQRQSVYPNLPARLCDRPGQSCFRLGERAFSHGEGLLNDDYIDQDRNYYRQAEKREAGVTFDTRNDFSFEEYGRVVKSPEDHKAFLQLHAARFALKNDLDDERRQEMQAATDSMAPGVRASDQRQAVLAMQSQSAQEKKKRIEVEILADNPTKEQRVEQRFERLFYTAALLNYVQKLEGQAVSDQVKFLFMKEMGLIDKEKSFESSECVSTMLEVTQWQERQKKPEWGTICQQAIDIQNGLYFIGFALSDSNHDFVTTCEQQKKVLLEKLLRNPDEPSESDRQVLTTLADFVCEVRRQCEEISSSVFMSRASRKNQFAKQVLEVQSGLFAKLKEHTEDNLQENQAVLQGLTVLSEMATTVSRVEKDFTVITKAYSESAFVKKVQGLLDNFHQEFSQEGESWHNSENLAELKRLQPAVFAIAQELRGIDNSFKVLQGKGAQAVQDSPLLEVAEEQRKKLLDELALVLQDSKAPNLQSCQPYKRLCDLNTMLQGVTSKQSQSNKKQAVENYLQGSVQQLSLPKRVANKCWKAVMGCIKSIPQALNTALRGAASTLRMYNPAPLSPIEINTIRGKAPVSAENKASKVAALFKTADEEFADQLNAHIDVSSSK